MTPDCSLHFVFKEMHYHSTMSIEGWGGFLDIILLSMTPSTSLKKSQATSILTSF